MGNDTVKKLIVVISFLLGLGFYIGAILIAGLDSLKGPNEPAIPEILSALVTGVGGALATNFGAFMGISLNTTGGATAFKVPQFQMPSVQSIGALVYFVSLLAALGFWAADSFSPTTAELIRNQGATLAGAIVGIVVVSLNTKRP